MQLTPHEIVVMFLAVGVLLTAARLLGELARALGLPSVLGEILAGVLLGPTVMGSLAPGVSAYLFPTSGANALILQGLVTLAVALFLLVAGMELDLSTIWRQGKTALAVGLAGIAVPFSIGLLTAAAWPGAMGAAPEADRVIFAVFIATALSISALPVIAKTLIDLNLYRSDMGMIVVAAAIFNDLAGWIIFAVILGMIGGASHGFSIGWTIGLTLAYTAGMLTLGRWLIHRALPWIQAYTSAPGGVLGFALSLALLGAAFTEWIGVHAIFGSFLVGVAVGDSSHLREHTRNIIGQFVSFIFAPLFFASIGLRVNFVAHFDLSLTLLLLAIACAGKILGCGLGARWGGMPWNESWAIGFGMNARGAMEIILGLFALQYGIIDEPLFVALVVVALVTSLMGGWAIQALLRPDKPRAVTDFMAGRAFVPKLRGATSEAVIHELSQALAAAQSAVPAEAIERAVLGRERIMATGLEHGLAVPHARLPGLAAPLIGLGISEEGVDFDAPDGRPARLVFMILTPMPDNGAQLEILASISRAFGQPALRDRALQVGNYTELLALLRTEAGA